MKILQFLLKTPLRILISIINLITIKYFFGYKSSFTQIDKLTENKKIYILGSGSSINSISKNQWKDISDNFSIGLNYWIVHDFIPDVIQIEFISSEKKEYSELILKILESRKKDFAKTIFLVKSNYLFWWNYAHLTNILSRIPIELKSNFVFSSDFPNLSNSISSFISEFNLLKSIGFFEKKTLFKFDLRASLGYTICFLIQRKISEIILCGVDLNNGNYFYENKLQYYNSKYNINLKYSKVKIHLTNDSSYFGLTISEIIIFLNKTFSREKNDLIKVISKESALYPSIKIHNL